MMKALLTLAAGAGGGYASGFVRAKRPQVMGVDSDLAVGLAATGLSMVGPLKNKPYALGLAAGALGGYTSRLSRSRGTSVEGLYEIGDGEMYDEDYTYEIGAGADDEPRTYNTHTEDYVEDVAYG